MQPAKTAGLLLALAIGLVCCGCGSGDAYDQKLADYDASQAKHPNYPILKRVDFGADNGPLGMLVYGNYGYARVPANDKSEPLDAAGTSKSISKAIALAIGEIQKIEKESPAPSKPPTSPEWQKAPHPDLGSYTINVSAGLDLPPITVSGKAGQPIEQETAAVDAAAGQIVAALVKNEAAGLASATSPLPPSGFRVVTKEAMDAFAAARGNGPNPILKSANMLILPIDPTKATASLKRSAMEAAKRLHDTNPAAKGANLVIRGPNGETDITVVFGPTQAKKIDAGLAPITAWLETIDKQIAHP